MASGTIITNYLGEGTHAARPAAPPVPTGGLAFYYETDTTTLFYYDISTTSWKSVSSGGGGGGDFVKISEVVTAGSQASVTFATIAGTYRDLIIRVRGRGDTAASAVNIALQFNADTGSNYDYQTSVTEGTFTSFSNTLADTSMFIGQIAAASATANYSGATEATIYDYRGTTFNKSVLSRYGESTTTSGNAIVAAFTTGGWRSTVAITSVKVLLSAGNFVNNSVVTLYGSN